MDRTTILSLDYDCLVLIFESIKTNCETDKNSKKKENVVKYRDLINFVISCVEFQIAFQNWNNKLFHDLRIEYFHLRDTSSVSVNFSKTYDLLQNFSKKDKDHFWNYYTTAIKENVNMDSLVLTYKPTQYHREHLDRFQAIMHSLKNKTLHDLVVDFKGSGYSFENVGTFGHLRSLNVNARMCAYDLVQLCRSNPNLYNLTFYSTELNGRFSDIVSYCSQLKRLELLMKPDVDATEYATLANLPQLEELYLGGIHEEGTLTELFNGLKLKGLKKLHIRNSMLSKQETQALAQIRSIISIESAFSDDPIIGNLAHLRNLKSIKVFARREQYNLLIQFKNLIKKVEVSFNTKCMGLGIKLSPISGNLFLTLSTLYNVCDNDEAPREILNFLKPHSSNIFKNVCDNDEVSSDILNFITPLSQRIEVNQLHIAGFSGFLQALLQSLANQKLRNVHMLDIISMEEAYSLVSIPSLNNIYCVQNLEEIIAMKCKQLDGIKNTETRVYLFRNPDWTARINHGNFLTTIVEPAAAFDFFCFFWPIDNY
ncbi:uncharacterized protein LOC108039521 [Drosophila rhopaloa]|uniref:Uncharacterized protein n=2 Tax=Drosophila rhopaloa TaxID=1041015 RepID=A0ABM5GZ47_DRORH|nr:uncharacterized protein LOC108039521 [Drosophila rhopaloa]